ncbi:MAG: hypothetical protein AB8G22_12465 [Saprospiraceae bacterium]
MNEAKVLFDLHLELQLKTLSMTLKQLLLNSRLLIFGTPLLLILFCVGLVNSPYFAQYPQDLATGITLDLVVTLPIVWFLLIRKTDIPKITVASSFILGLVIASYILPAEQQTLLALIKKVAFPLVETGVLLFVFYTFRKTWKAFKTEKNVRPEFYTALTTATQQVLPGRVGILLATEIAVVYYGIIAWRKHLLAANEYHYHKKSGIILVLYVFIGLLAGETFAMHILVEKWSPTVAWVLTGLSVYSAFQIIALTRSMSRRPIIMDKENDTLYLRYGFFSEATIKISDIERVEMTARSLPADQGLVELTPLGMLDSHNLVLHLKSDDNTLNSLYGRKSTFRGIAIYVDEKQRFVEELGF